MKNILEELPQEYDIKTIPLLSINGTETVHETISSLITKLPDKNSKFTFDFDNYDWSLEEVQSYNVIANGILSVLVTINSTIIGIAVMLKCKKFWNKRDEKRNDWRWRDSLKYNFNRFRQPSRGSLRNKFRGSVRKGRTKMNEIRNSLNNLKRHGNNKTELKNVGTNTDNGQTNIFLENETSTPMRTQRLPKQKSAPLPIFA